VALMLSRQGLTRVRPLAGGLAGWRERGFSVENRSARKDLHGPEGKSGG
jgi:3-mercaptopyruvate sulfurtransferase SseA